MIGKLSANPRTAKHLSDPGFVNTVGEFNMPFYSIALRTVTYTALSDPEEPFLGRRVSGLPFAMT